MNASVKSMRDKLEHLQSIIDENQYQSSKKGSDDTITSFINDPGQISDSSVGSYDEVEAYKIRLSAAEEQKVAIKLQLDETIKEFSDTVMQYGNIKSDLEREILQHKRFSAQASFELDESKSNVKRL